MAGGEERVVDGGPRVKLRRCFADPYDGSIAAARTCYSERVIEVDEVTPGQRRRIGRLTYDAGHHTVFQHSTFEFGLEGVSRQLVWSFLHRHPFYNSEQQSQRYVVISRPAAHVPPALGGEDRELYERALFEGWRAYRELGELLRPIVRERLAKLWNLDTRRSKSFRRSIERDVEKRAIETARYVVPVACHTALVHTISGIVLHRLRRMTAASDAPDEARALVERMVACVEEVDPEFFAHVGAGPLDAAALPESISSSQGAASQQWRAEFDASLVGAAARLVAYTPGAPSRVADAVRDVLGRSAAELDDARALDAVLDPERNPLRLETLNVSMHSPLMIALEHAHYTFRKKLSHSADSQDQRHRTVPGSRPLLSRHDSPDPDVIVPELIASDPRARARFDAAVGLLWDAKNRLVKRGVDVRLAQYLLPNALAVRFQESGTLLHLLHKWTTRTCLNAQREIYEASMQELAQVRSVHPELCKHIGPPCVVRDGRVRPRCPEGDHFCGVPVWRSFPAIERAL
jgi:thymidylate synthase ThyX